MTKGQSAASLADVSLTVHAPAKINLILRILDRRPDLYHNLWSLMHTVALEDDLRMRVTPFRCGIRLTCDMEGLATDHTNLISKAAAAVLEQARVSVGVEIELQKRIPTGAGLGGGSSDAAATILGLNRLLKLGWSTAKMQEVGHALGSDVAFFLFAPSAIVSGRGETVRPITVDGPRWIVLVKPAFGVETKWAYQELAATRTEIRPLSADHLEIDRRNHVTWRELSTAAENDFEKPVFAKHPLLKQIKRTLVNLGAQFALLSGSGATVFGLFDMESVARRAADQIAQDSKVKIFVVSTCSEHLRTSLTSESQGMVG
ncbi:MAG TPA: 4-(cytidine 5'-diphospho)-2-C-methyl-D-erythritol kinase [Nitrospira sp.]|nr:4-(cytidine 5'-diphospho)-2-C-methyl-D-erythritol kinase [Nitrospira sp.]